MTRRTTQRDDELVEFQVAFADAAEAYFDLVEREAHLGYVSEAHLKAADKALGALEAVKSARKRSEQSPRGVSPDER